MTVRASLDKGRTWPHAKLLHEGPSAHLCLAPLAGGRIGMLYERGTSGSYEEIVDARYSLDWLTSR